MYSRISMLLREQVESMEKVKYTRKHASRIIGFRDATRYGTHEEVATEIV